MIWCLVIFSTLFLIPVSSLSWTQNYCSFNHSAKPPKKLTFNTLVIDIQKVAYLIFFNMSPPQIFPWLPLCKEGTSHSGSLITTDIIFYIDLFFVWTPHLNIILLSMETQCTVISLHNKNNNFHTVGILKVLDELVATTFVYIYVKICWKNKYIACETVQSECMYIQVLLIC